tara:strand:+ start:496 stop:1203 length:708 start_codon:yes stop_codon:yes gene_type:complete
MKKFFLFTILAFSLGVNAQYFSITYINVSFEDVPEVARLETTYWSKVAKANIDAGKQLGWGFFARVGGNSDTWTHAFVNVYETIEQMTDQSIWNPEELIGISNSDISTVQYYNGSGTNHWKIQGQINGMGGAAIWNYGRPENLQGYVEDNLKYWKPFFENDMNGRAYWGIATKITGVNQTNSTVMTFDGYETVADALSTLAGEGSFSAPRGTKYQEYDPNGFLARVVVQEIMWVD